MTTKKQTSTKKEKRPREKSPTGRGPLTPGEQKTIKAEIIERLLSEPVLIVQLSIDLDVSRQTIYRWRREDEKFRAAFDDALKNQDGMRNEAVEDALLERLVSGTAAPLEYIYYLNNRLPERWRDQRHVRTESESSVIDRVLARAEEIEIEDSKTAKKKPRKKTAAKPRRRTNRKSRPRKT